MNEQKHMQDEISWLNCSQGMDGWQDHQQSPWKQPNIFASLSKNLSAYENAFRQSTKLQMKSSLKLPSHLRRTKQVKSVIARPENKLYKKVAEIVSENRQKENSFRANRKQRTSMSREGKLMYCFEQPILINIKNLNFDQKSEGAKKKREKYRQIFGERPKYILRRSSHRNSQHPFAKHQLLRFR